MDSLDETQPLVAPGLRAGRGLEPHTLGRKFAFSVVAPGLMGARAPTFDLREIDTLTGGDGADTFVLATDSGAFYNDDKNRNSGLRDYAVITDFNASVDTIQLKNGFSYVLGSVPSSTGLSGTGLFIDSDSIVGLSANDELIGVLQNLTLTPGIITNSTTGFAFV
jgi:hypothetical protein